MIGNTSYSGFGEGSKDAEAFSDALLFIRKHQLRHGPHAKKGSALLIGHTREKVAKSIRRVASFGIEKPHRDQPDKARILDSEGGTDTAENYAEYDLSEFTIEEAYNDDEAGTTVDLDGERKNEAIKTVVRACVEQGMTYEDAAGLVEYGDYWVGERVREWKNGDHDFVPVERPDSD